MSDEQARARAISDYKTTFLVEAGAGTGKTTLLIDRICGLLETDALAEEIVAVTFTVKAAGELKDKLRIALARRTSERAKQALKDLDRMLVNTIHGLASELLRTLPVEAKLPPEFTALDELQHNTAREEFRYAWLAKALDAPVPVSLELAAELGLDIVGDSKKSISKLFDVLNKIPSDLNNISTGNAGAADLEIVVGVIEQIARQLARTATQCADPSDKLAAAIASASAWAGARPTDLLTRAGIDWLNSFKKPGKNDGIKGNWGSAEAKAEVLATFEQLGTAVCSAMQTITSVVIQDCMTWLSRSNIEFRNGLRESGQIGFDDLLILCRDMLRDSQVARSHFKSRFKFLHIDEFQDTDPTQVEILFFLAEVENEFARDWLTLTLQPGKLFVVGDPKQSIYSFRGADVRIYNRVAKRIEATGEKLNITRNFRSRAGIIEEVNAVFSAVMQNETEETPTYQPLDCARTGEQEYADVEIIVPPASYDIATTLAPQAARAEAEAIAEHLLRTKESGELTCYSHAAILMRGGTQLDILQNTLSAHKLPFISFMNSAFTSRVEIESTLTALSAIANPQHTVATIGVLRSPWFTISDEEIFGHKFSGKSFVYTDAQPTETKVGQALAQLANWHRQSKHMSAGDLLEEMLNHEPVEIHYGLKSEGVQRVQNLRTLIDLVRRLESGGLLGLQAVVGRLFAMTKLVQGTELDARDGSRDAIQILTLHKAKGLEFRVVYLFRLRDSLKDRGEWQFRKSLEDGPHRIGISFDKKKCWKTETFDDLKTENERAQLAEEQRLQYVGMTRARDRLILPLGWAHGKEIKDEEYLPEAFRKRYYAVETKRISVENTQALLLEAAVQPNSDFRAYRPQFGENTQKESNALILGKWQTWQTQHAARVAELTRSASQLPQIQPEPVEWSRVRAQRIGTAVHAVLERLAKLAPLAEATAFARTRFSLSESEFTETLELAQVAAASPIFTDELPSARRVFTELPISESHDDETTSRFVDLVFQNAHGEWIVVDYKTDDITLEQLPAVIEQKYRKQLTNYAKLLERLIGAPPLETRLFFLRLNRTVLIK